LHEADEEQYYGTASEYDAPAEPTAETRADVVITPSDDVDLDSDPFADDLSKELAAAAPKRWANRATVVIGALALVVGGFLGGAQVQKHFGTSTSAPAAGRGGAFGGGNLGAARGGGFGGTGTGGTGTGAATGTGAGIGTGARGGAAGTPTSGTIKLVDGDTIYVQLANGDIVTVKTTGSTKVSIASSGKLSSLKTGEKVSVAGAADSSGTVTATTVTATP
jgi:Cu/Ag efflux protein CusF